MRYGFFDNENKEYVIDKVDCPQSMTNYIGVNKMCAVLNQNAGGYAFYETPQFQRITRFRPNGVPLDRPGHYVYIRDNDTGEFYTISWQPVGLDLEKAKYTCRHGLSYSKYECDYNDLLAEQTIFIPVDDPVELWDVKLKNNGKKRNLSIFSYIEFSYHHIDMDNQNYQMSLYSSGSSYDKGVIEYDLFYEEFGFQYFASNFTPDGFDCIRDKFIGSYRTETDPLVVEKGECSSSFKTTGNHCGVLQKNIVLDENEETRLVFMLGQGNMTEGAKAKEKYSNLDTVDKAFDELANFWYKKLNKLQIKTPDEGMNTSLNIWNLYQSEINVIFSRFASFIEVGGRTGLGYRDTAQDSMCVQHSNPEKCKSRIEELLQALTTDGYGVHLFQPEWFSDEEQPKPFESPTVTPEIDMGSLFRKDLRDVCSDDALWLVTSIVEYVRETGEFEFLDKIITYANGGQGSIFEHIEKILRFTYRERGINGIAKGLRADWNDCLNLGGGESAMVSYLHYWSISHYIDLLKYLDKDYSEFEKMGNDVKDICEEVLWDRDWYIRGITKNNIKIGSHVDKEGKVHLESNVWAVASGVSTGDRAIKALDAIEKYLGTKYGVMLNAPSYTIPDEDIGFITRVYPGIKENGAIFSHPNPWVWMAECMMGRGNKAKEYYDSLLGYNQNDMMEIRKAEPYTYCQFVVGVDHEDFGEAKHPFMTGTAGWAYYSATKYMLGIRPDFDNLVIEPCIPSDWKSFEVSRVWRGATYNITVENPDNIEKGIKSIYLNKKLVDKIPVMKQDSINEVKIIMGAN